MNPSLFNFASMGMYEFQNYYNPSEYNTLRPWEIPLNSSCLSRVSYNPLTGTLNVTFNFDGTTGSYLNVSFGDFYGLVTSPSVGKYFNLYIKNQHEWVAGGIE